MDELGWFERTWAWVKAHRIESTFVFLFLLNPILTYLLTHQWKKFAQSFLGRFLKRWEIWSIAVVLSLLMSLSVSIRWGDLHWVDALMLALPVACLVPYTVKIIMDATRDSPRFGWIYRAMSLAKDDKSATGGADDTVFGGEP